MSKAMEKKIVVVGTGPTGLGSAVRLTQLGHKNWEVLEAEDQAAGLANTYTTPEGFLFDVGGHVIFSHYPYFDQVLDWAVSDWCYHQRESWVMKDRKWVPYPFQNNIHRLETETKLKCLDGLVEKVSQTGMKPKPANFHEWILQNFGQGIADVFMTPYNFKVWAYPTHTMGVEWMGERVPTVDLKRIIRNVVTNSDDAGWGPNALFRFPKFNGTGGIWRSVADKLPKERMRYNCGVKQVDSASKTLTLVDNSTVTYDSLITTIPLDLFVQMDVSASDSAKEAAAQLIHSTTHVVGLGMKGAAPPEFATKCWMYFPDDDCPFYRATVFSNYSPNNVPAPGEQWSLMFEVSESTAKPVDADVLQATIDASVRIGLIGSADEIISKFYKSFSYGYPTPFLGRDTLVHKLVNEYREKQVWNRGRFGGWKYEVANQDHSFMQGVEAVDNVLFGSEESTFWHPDLVNTRSQTLCTRSFEPL